MGPRPYRSQHAPFLSTANRWQCGDTDGTETYRWKTGTKQQRIYSHSTFQRLEKQPFPSHSRGNVHVASSGSPEQARHGVPGSVVQRSVVLVGFTVGRVGIQSVSELLVALVQLAG